MSFKIDSHPMLEPLDFDFDPSQASKILGGNSLQVYSLLWRAAVASQAEGPLLKHKRIYGRLNDKYYLSSNWYEVLEPGWSDFFNNELEKNLGEVYLYSNKGYDNYTSTYDLKFKNDFISQSSESCKLNFSFNFSGCVDIKMVPAQKLTYSKLIDQMSASRIGRPSTYSSRIEAALKNNLMILKDDGLRLTENSREFISSIRELPVSEQIDKDFSAQIENSIEAITNDASLAGSELNKYTSQLFGKSTALSDWLDNLDVNEFCISQQPNLEEGLRSEMPTYFPECLDQEELKGNLAKILGESNDTLSVRASENQWDDYVFQTSILGISIKGRLHARRANPSSVSKEKIFREHLDDFKIITFYCLLAKIPNIDQIELINFVVQTDRSRGFLYLNDLVVKYRVDEYFSKLCHEDDVSSQEILENYRQYYQEKISEVLSEVDYNGFLYLISSWEEGVPTISCVFD